MSKDVVTINIFNFCDEKKHHKKAVAGRFPGVTYVNPNTGKVTTVTQQVPPNTALTGPLLFVDQDGNAVKGPIGTITADTPGVTVSLSADGQSFNFTSPGSGVSYNLIWTDPAGNVASFSGSFTDAVVTVITGSFGTAVPGTTP